MSGASLSPHINPPVHAILQPFPSSSSLIYKIFLLLSNILNINPEKDHMRHRAAATVSTTTVATIAAIANDIDIGSQQWQ